MNTPTPLTKLDEEGRQLVFRSTDIQARIFLINLSEMAYEDGELEASATLFHAEMYLGDRLAYEQSPAPKNCIPIPYRKAAP